MKTRNLFAAIIFGTALFAMVSCNNNATPENNDSVIEDTTEQQDMVAPEHNCQDSACAATNCENCAKKGTPECCKNKAGESGCCKEAAEGCCKNHEGCKEGHEGCKHHEGCKGHEGCEHHK